MGLRMRVRGLASLFARALVSFHFSSAKPRLLVFFAGASRRSKPNARHGDPERRRSNPKPSTPTNEESKNEEVKIMYELDRPQRSKLYLAMLEALADHQQVEPLAHIVAFENLDASVGLTFTLYEGITFAVESSGKERITLDASKILGYGQQAVTRAMALAGFLPTGDGETFTNAENAANTHRIKLPHDLIARWYE